MSTDSSLVMRYRYSQAQTEFVQNRMLEDHTDTTASVSQRKITRTSFEVLQIDCPNVQIFDKLLIQFPTEGQEAPGQVVPDNMVLVHDDPIEADGSYDLPFQPVGPLLVLEYVSRSNKRKDFEISFEKYERQLRVPYYLLFDPEPIELILFHLQENRYVSIPPSAQGRHPIPELDLEVAILENWVRYWYRGELLPLTGDLVAESREMRQRLREQTQRAEEATREADEQRQRADEAEREMAKLREELERLRGEQS